MRIEGIREPILDRLAKLADPISIQPNAGQSIRWAHMKTADPKTDHRPLATERRFFPLTVYRTVIIMLL
jgi:hypothetical protein